MAERKLNDQEIARRNKLEKYVELGVKPFGQKFVRTHLTKEIHDKYDSYTEEQLAEVKDTFVLAGRIKFIRKMGKASFFSFQDRSGKLQAYISIDTAGEENYSIFKMADIGDICGIEGHIMKTRTGELSIKVVKYTHIVKSLQPLPEKFHGLTDVEERYRKRYIDLIMNEDALNIAFMRPKIIRSIQHFLDKKDFVEVETSILQPILGGASARPFVTHHNALDKDFYLRIATELGLKKLLVGGMERVYEIGRMFRNEGIDTTHNPEFTSLELYQAYGDLQDMMDLTEEMFRTLAQEVRGTYKIDWLGHTIDLEPSFKRATMVDLIKEKIGVDFKEVKNDDEAKELAKKYNVPLEKHFTYGHIVNAFFEQFVEEDLVQPTFVMGHPIEISPLTQKDDVDPRFTKRFELYISTKEMCNAYTELNDPIDQRQRFEEQLKEKNLGNEEANEIDESFLDALEIGMPPAGGIGYGIDRLVMFLTSQDSIREVLLFPTMKPLD